MTSLATRRAFLEGQRRGSAVAELCRLQITRLPLLVFGSAAFVAGVSMAHLVGGLLLIAGTCAVAAARNDLDHVVTDRCNDRDDRPLVSGVADERDAHLVIVVGTITAVGSVSLLPQPSGLLVAGLALLVGWAYACRPLALQRRGGVGLIVLAAGYLWLPMALAIGTSAAAALPVVVLGAGVLAHKDVRDAPGDRAGGKLTLVVRHGVDGMAWRAAVLGALGCIGLAVTLSPGPWTLAAAATVVSLTLLWRIGHRRELWTVARVAVIATAVLVATSLAAVVTS